MHLVNKSRDLITLINKDYVYEIANDAYLKAIGKEREEIVGKTVAEVWGEERFESSIKKHLLEGLAGREVEYIERFRFGPFERHMHVTYSPYWDEDGHITHVSVYSHDITHISQIESKLTQYEFRDPTTGLFNRKSLDIILDKEIAQAIRSPGTMGAVLFISIDNLGKVNETFGMATGDLLLENTGLRIQRCISSQDFLFRFVGNELACLLVHQGRTSDAAHVAKAIVEEMQDSLPPRGRGHPHGVQHRDRGATPTTARTRQPSSATRAPPCARHGARGRSSSSTTSRRIRAPPTSCVLESELHQAFERDQFHLVYQPIVDRAGKIKGAEALIRWQHPEKGLVAPNAFIPLAEETGIIQSITKWALFAAAEHVARWSQRYGIYVSVNLSAVDFANPDLPEILASALRRAGVDFAGLPEAGSHGAASA